MECVKQYDEKGMYVTKQTGGMRSSRNQVRSFLSFSTEMRGWEGWTPGKDFGFSHMSGKASKRIKPKQNQGILLLS